MGRSVSRGDLLDAETPAPGKRRRGGNRKAGLRGWRASEARGSSVGEEREEPCERRSGGENGAGEMEPFVNTYFEERLEQLFDLAELVERTRRQRRTRGG